LLNPACLGPVNGPPITSGNIAVHDGPPNSPGLTAAEAEALQEEALQERRNLRIE
jgi:hypothetical protein